MSTSAMSNSPGPRVGDSEYRYRLWRAWRRTISSRRWNFVAKPNTATRNSGLESDAWAISLFSSGTLISLAGF